MSSFRTTRKPFNEADVRASDRAGGSDGSIWQDTDKAPCETLGESGTVRGKHWNDLSIMAR